MDDFENSVDAVEIDYHTGDLIITCYVYNLITPQFNKVNISQYGKGNNFKQDIVEYIVNNCYIPTKGNCFKKCINYFTKKDYSEEL